MADEIVKPKMGRPTKYDPAYCDEVQKAMGDGYSLTAFAGMIDVDRATLNAWMAAHPDFNKAVSRAKAKRLLHWEKSAMKVADHGGGPGTATIIVFGLKNMGGDEWSDTTKNEVSGPGGGPIETKDVSARDVLASKLAGLTTAGRAPDDPGEPDGSSS